MTSPASLWSTLCSSIIFVSYPCIRLEVLMQGRGYVHAVQRTITTQASYLHAFFLLFFFFFFPLPSPSDKAWQEENYYHLLCTWWRAAPVSSQTGNFNGVCFAHTTARCWSSVEIFTQKLGNLLTCNSPLLCADPTCRAPANSIMVRWAALALSCLFWFDVVALPSTNVFFRQAYI